MTERKYGSTGIVKTYFTKICMVGFKNIENFSESLEFFKVNSNKNISM